MRNQETFLDHWYHHYVILRWPFWEKPWPPSWTFQKLSPSEAVRVVCDCAGDPEAPDHRLLRFLEIDEHPQNMQPGELEHVVERLLGDLHFARFIVYRRERTVSSAGSKREADLTLDAASAAELSPVGAPQPKSWVGLELVSEGGTPLSGMRVELTAPDGDVRTLATDERGQAVAHGLPAGSCGIALATVDAKRWAPDSVVRKEAGPTHVVRQGECLSRIAYRLGYSDWQKIWSDDQNAALKRKRKSPHVLLPGDMIILPSIEIGMIERGTDAMHRIVVADPQDELVTVRLKLESRWKKAFEGLEYKLSFVQDGELVTRPGAGPTSSSGEIEENVPARADSILVAFERPKICFKLRVGALDPLQDGEDGAVVPTGLEARLRALGYAPLDGSSSAATASFQRSELGREEPTGELDAETRGKLEQLYGA